MTLRIGVDATAWSNERGDGRFLRNAVHRLVALYPETEWTLYADARSAARIEDEVGARVTAVRQRRPPTEALATGSARGPLDVARLTRAVRRGGLDAFLAPSVFSWFPVIGVPSVVGLHDATASTHPRLVLPSLRDRALWRVKRALALRRASRLFTVSETSRTAISDSLGLSAAAIAVVPEAADPAFEPQPRQAVEAAISKLGLAGERPLVFAAGLSPHKGLDDLVEAYATAQAPMPPLVIAGSLGGPYPSAAERARKRGAELGVAQSVRFPGFVPDHDLACLYGAATAAIVPSHSEGFSLSALEAAACGAPVVLSDVGAHRETLEGAALFFPAGDRAALRDRLSELVSDPGLGRELGERGMAAAARLSWDETARRLYALLAEVAGGARPTGQSTTRSPEAAER
jgi:glycosyltransferase involved in cell wall biosynthesis